jgi:AraC-like DNA-binding protein
MPHHARGSIGDRAKTVCFWRQLAEGGGSRHPVSRVRRVAAIPFRSRIIRLLFVFLRAQGIDPGVLIARHGLPADAESAPWVDLTVQALHDVFTDAAELVKDPSLGVHLAMLFERGTFGIVEYCSRNAPTFGEAATRVARYMGLLNDAARASWTETPSEGVFRHTVEGSPLCVGRHANELIVCSILVETRKLTQDPFVPRRVFFAHPRPADTSDLARIAGTSELEFDADGIGFVVSPEACRLAFRQADSTLLSILDEQASTLVAGRPSSQDSFLVRVRRSIEKNLTGALPSLTVIAGDLRMSPRTLQRRLMDEKTSFGAELEAVREQLACAHVRENKVPLGEIAFLLGYAHVSTFLRAFKRWTGTTPSRFRK